MLVALSPSVLRLRMSSLEYHGDAISAKGETKSTSVVEGGVSSVAMTEITTTTAIAGRSRPKLSLQTSSLPSPYTKSSKGVLGSASIVSGTATPTTSNTIANASQNIPLRPSPATPKSAFSKPPQSRPYTQPIGLRSILKNGPESPKLGIKRSHSLFSADSSSPHMTRRIFFPPVKKVKFEAEEKLAVAIPSKEPELSPASSSAESETSIPDEPTSTADAKEAPRTPSVTMPPQVLGAPRTRNGTPPPSIAPSNKKRKIRKWEWTITSPVLAKLKDDSDSPPVLTEADDSSDKPPAAA
jgi:hypothetical protein